MSEILTCDICGYASETDVRLYLDNVLRCIMCATKAAWGRNIAGRELQFMSNARLEALNVQYAAWCNSLKEGDNGND